MCIGTEMLTKEKRVREIFLFFLITFTHSSFPLSWGTIGKKTCSYSVKSFQYIEKFLGTKFGSIVGQILIGVCIIYALKKIFDNSDGSEINRYKKKPGKKALNFKDDYVGDPPSGIRTAMNNILYSKAYSEFGVNPKKGILICGPPGVGKTWLAEILADEVDAGMFIVNGSYLKGGGLRGSGSERVRKVFSKARNIKKHAIIVIDEFDAISRSVSSSGEEDTEALDRFLTEMEGFDTKKNDKITVIGLTNKPYKLGPALLRRFNTTQIDLPDEKAREELLEFYVKKHMGFKKSRECCILKNVKLGVLAQQSSTGGFSHDNLKSVATHVFTQVAELKSGFRNRDSHGLTLYEGNIVIQHEAFKVAVQNFKNQTKHGSKNFLVKSNDPIPEHILHSMYA